LISDAVRDCGNDDKELVAELIRRIDEPGLRAETERRSKETP
jgi:hypothetical protein